MVTVGTVAIGGVVLAAVLMLVLLVLERPTVGRGAVLGALPWMIAAGLLHALGVYGPYPSGVRPLVQFPVGLLLVFVIASLLWVLTRQFAVLRNVTGGSGRYIAAAGGGAAIVLLTRLALVTSPGVEALFWLAAAPAAGATLAGVGMLTLGVLDSTALARMRWVGWLVAFDFTLLGVVVTVGIDVFGVATTPATAAVVNVGAALPTASFSVAWPLVAVGCGLGLAMVSALARVVEADAASGFILSVALAVGTVSPSVALLVTTVLR